MLVLTFDTGVGEWAKRFRARLTSTVRVMMQPRPIPSLASRASTRKDARVA
jgi:hypothetical protein